MENNEELNLAKSDEKVEKKQEGEGEKPAPKPPEPYIMFGSDQVITEPEFIIYAKYRMKMLIMKYKLVGTVNNKGQYTISDDIKRDLIRMEKEIADSDDTYFKAIALYMKKHFHYNVKIEQVEGGKAKASLYLAEWVDDYLGSEYIYTHIADFTDVNDANFLNKVRKAYHLVNVNVKIDDFAVPELAVRMQEIFDINFVEGALYDMACQIYLASIVQLLEKGGPESLALLEEYRRLLAEGNLDPNDRFKYIKYKSLLDRLIDEKGGFDKIGLDPKEVSRIVTEMNKTLLQIDSASKRGPLEVLTSPSDEKDLKSMVQGKDKGAKPPAAAKPQQPNKVAGKKNDKKDDKKSNQWYEYAEDWFGAPGDSSSLNLSSDGGILRDLVEGAKELGKDIFEAVTHGDTPENESNNGAEPVAVAGGEGQPKEVDDKEDSGFFKDFDLDPDTMVSVHPEESHFADAELEGGGRDFKEI